MNRIGTDFLETSQVIFHSLDNLIRSPFLSCSWEILKTTIDAKFPNEKKNSKVKSAFRDFLRSVDFLIIKYDQTIKSDCNYKTYSPCF